MPKEKDKRNIWSQDTHQTTDARSSENIKQTKYKIEYYKKKKNTRYTKTVEKLTQWLKMDLDYLKWLLSTLGQHQNSFKEVQLIGQERT